MAGVSVKLLGGFAVRRSTGATVAVPTRKARALLARLARRPGRAESREALAALLWPESAPREARGSLRQALKLARRALAAPGPVAIVGDADALALAPGAAEVDVDRFERLHEAGTPEALAEAAALYRGDFLEGTHLAAGPFAEWAAVERAGLRERAGDVFSRLLDHHAEAGRTGPAIETALRLLALDPLQEHVHRRLMELYLAAGRRGSALAQYRLCRLTLERELGIAPEPETERLHEAIRRRPARIAPPASAAKSAAGPVAGFVSGSVADSGGEPAPAARDSFLARPAVAVLPFADLGGDPDEAYFSDGLSEDIITALAGWRSFPVIASSSTLACRDQRGDVRAVGDSLGARYVVDGSVRRMGRRMRITARLVESAGGRHLWAERFDLERGDVLAVQDEAAQRIATVVEPELERAELHRIVAKRTEDLTAWEYCLRGTSYLHRYTPEANARARASFEKALALDPEYADAFTGLAFGHLRDVRGAAPGAREGLVAKGLAAAREAVVLDSRSSMARLAFAEAHVWAEAFDVAIPETELAIELNPSNASARMALGNRLDLVGRAAEGIAQMELGLRLNPRDPWRFTYMGFLSRAHIALGDYETGLRWIRDAVRLRPDLPELHFRHAIALAHLDMAAEARAALRECERLHPGFVAARKAWRPYAEAGRNRRVFAGLRRHGLHA